MIVREHRGLAGPANYQLTVQILQPELLNESTNYSAVKKYPVFPLPLLLLLTALGSTLTSLHPWREPVTHGAVSICSCCSRESTLPGKGAVPVVVSPCQATSAVIGRNGWHFRAMQTRDWTGLGEELWYEAETRWSKTVFTVPINEASMMT
ncbi:hypothetical protein ElyMa_005912300 [Elysia marginata]|uniref:Uncharacterized protein n=1 Tax=Elysia marginata TaxID=1093978 RepID=A0AAV4G8P6_9GAST|nr:hypothetical protein ElyMa_005912300 [Elysia marginata]